MIIKIDNYRLIQDGRTFHLNKIIKSEETLLIEEDGKKKRVKTGNLIDREVEFGYNMDLTSAVHKIIMENISKIDLVLDLKGWIKMYRDERERINKLINS